MSVYRPALLRWLWVARLVESGPLRMAHRTYAAGITRPRTRRFGAFSSIFCVLVLDLEARQGGHRVGRESEDLVQAREQQH